MRDGAEAGARREVRRRSEEEGNSKAVISFWEFNKSEAFIFSLWICESLFERPVKDYIIDWNLVERDSPSSQKMTHAAVSWQFITSPPHTAGRAVVNMQINEAAFLPASINTPSKQLLMRLQTASVCCVCVTVMQLLLLLSFFLFFWGGGVFCALFDSLTAEKPDKKHVERAKQDATCRTGTVMHSCKFECIPCENLIIIIINLYSISDHSRVS